MNMGKQKTNGNTTTTTTKRKSIPLADKLAQLRAMADSDETVAAILPAIDAAVQAIDDAKPALKRAKRRLRKLVAAALSGTDE
jgi:hypothetical protein